LLLSFVVYLALLRAGLNILMPISVDSVLGCFLDSLWRLQTLLMKASGHWFLARQLLQGLVIAGLGSYEFVHVLGLVV